MQVRGGQQRLVVFLSVMRHFAQALRDEALPLDHVQGDSFAQALAATLAATLAEPAVQRIVLTGPGDHRVHEALQQAAAGVALELSPD